MGFVCRWADREIRYEKEEVSRQENMWENPPPSLPLLHSLGGGHSHITFALRKEGVVQNVTIYIVLIGCVKGRGVQNVKKMRDVIYGWPATSLRRWVD